MEVPYINLVRQHQSIKSELLNSIEKVLDKGDFILGDAVNELEQGLAKLTGSKHVLGLNSGTDALILCMNAYGIGEGDEVIVPPNSFLATASSVALAGAKPVFCDVRSDFNIDPDKLEDHITSNTRAIIAVHLTGRPADMDAIMEMAQKHDLVVIEDAAQAIGAKYNGKPVGSIGHVGCFSLHPLKNLSACGDAGFVTTNDDTVFEYLSKARNHGLKNRDECDFWSLNSRIDTIQAAILNEKLKYLDTWNNRRREIAHKYQDGCKNLVIVPTDDDVYHSVYHTFIIQTDRRDELMAFLQSNNIGCKVHYPIPIHYQKAAEYLGYKKGDFPETEKQCDQILSLPVFPELTDEEVDFVIKKITEFFG